MMHDGFHKRLIARLVCDQNRSFTTFFLTMLRNALT
jgi:hypothetical protein